MKLFKITRTALLFSCLLLCRFSKAQYKNDNLLFKTTYPEDLCKELNKYPGALVLDVRSAGEYNDTSSSTGLNIGHLKNALNIDVRQLPLQLHSLDAYRDKPVFVYCSHSQRSRRASKMLADSGFRNVININGGMTAIRALDDDQLPCSKTLLETKNKYAIISASELCRQWKGHTKDMILLDVRPDSAWQHISSNPKVNAMGSFKSTRHIALDELSSQINDLPKNKAIILTDNYGADAAKAASLLVDKGFTNISVLLEGIDRWLITSSDKTSCKDIYIPAVSYLIISSAEFGNLIKDKNDHLILDVRTQDEVSNKAKESYKNIGHIKNAVSIPVAELEARMTEIDAYRNKPVFVYAFSGSPEAYMAANTLVQKGFTNIRLLAGGLFNIRWTAANVAGMDHLGALVTDVPSENK
jgi:rhodanese-related sulfurtransferase